MNAAPSNPRRAPPRTDRAEQLNFIVPPVIGEFPPWNFRHFLQWALRKSDCRKGLGPMAMRFCHSAVKRVALRYV
jgi:hypothetical protein